jgi:hypothetical protein
VRAFEPPLRPTHALETAQIERYQGSDLDPAALIWVKALRGGDAKPVSLHEAAALQAPLRVKRVGFTRRPSLPVYPEQRTSRDRPGWSVSCQ